LSENHPFLSLHVLRGSYEGKRKEKERERERQWHASEPIYPLVTGGEGDAYRAHVRTRVSTLPFACSRAQCARIRADTYARTPLFLCLSLFLPLWQDTYMHVRARVPTHSYTHTLPRCSDRRKAEFHSVIFLRVKSAPKISALAGGTRARLDDQKRSQTVMKDSFSLPPSLPSSFLSLSFSSARRPRFSTAKYEM